MNEIIRWEYDYVYKKSNTNDRRNLALLNAYGAEGWELVQIITSGGESAETCKIHAYVFKRPISG